MNNSINNLPKSPSEIEINDALYVHRDLSWMSFNERVLQEAKDPSNPLFERIKFLGIYSKNIGEFFNVRMANHLNLIRMNKKMKKKLDFSPKKLLKKIISISNQQQTEFSRIMNQEINVELKNNGILIKDLNDLSPEQILFIKEYYNNTLRLYAQPLLMRGKKINPFLKNGSLYLGILLKEKNKSNGIKEYGILRIPSVELPRYILLPSHSEAKELIILDDIIRYSIPLLFPGFEIEGAFSFKLTRDAELYIDNEFSGNLKDMIRKSLIKRQIGPPARFVYDREMPDELRNYLSTAFELNKFDMIREGRYQNNFDLLDFPDFEKYELKNKKLMSLEYRPLQNESTIFRVIKMKDHMIHPPYHSYDSVVKFFEVAAKDSKVTEIKITQYRVSKSSLIMQNLMVAAKSGKKVTVFVEVKARFDEKSNLEWGEKLEAAGVKVIYSIPGIKVHSKIALVKRIERKKEKLYSFLSTGNFHEDNAKIYSDMGLFTADVAITKEVSSIFSNLEGEINNNIEYNHLLVGKSNLREKLIDMIDNEIRLAKLGKKASILLKMNSLQDKVMIDKLYEASQAKVDIRLIIRGVCCLKPNIVGLSENIKVISIVDRYLEHARVYVFNNDGIEKIYLSSADWMLRNLSRRIETAFPIYDKDLRNEIMTILNYQLNDNVKARIIDQKQTNKYVRNDSPKFQSQIEIYNYLLQKSNAMNHECVKHF